MANGIVGGELSMEKPCGKVPFFSSENILPHVREYAERVKFSSVMLVCRD